MRYISFRRARRLISNAENNVFRALARSCRYFALASKYKENEDQRAVGRTHDAPTMQPGLRMIHAITQFALQIMFVYMFNRPCVSAPATGTYKCLFSEGYRNCAISSPGFLPSAPHERERTSRGETERENTLAHSKYTSRARIN